jgi:hypothetical protein
MGGHDGVLSLDGRSRWGDAIAAFLIDAQSIVLVTMMKARGLQST